MNTSTVPLRKKSFLENYMYFTSGNEAHPNFHMWCALIALSSLVSRKVWVPQGYHDVYPNLYVVLVGPPASRKTTAMSICKALLREVKDIPFSAEATTKEALISEMAANQRTFKLPGLERLFQYAPMTVCVTELSQFLAASKENMVDFLTTVYDQDFYDYKTKHAAGNNKKHEEIFGPYLNLLACTTPSWIATYLKSDVISGGFSRRALFVYQHERFQRITFPEITPAAKAAWNEVVQQSQEIKKLSGVFTWTDEAKEFYHEWYQNLKVPDNPVVVGYYDSKHVQLLKISMLFAISESMGLTLQKHHIQMGLDLLAQTEINLEKVFGGVGRNELSMASNTIVEMVARSDGGIISEKMLRKLSYSMINEQEFYSVLQHLLKTEQLVESTLDKDGVKRKWYLTPEKAEQIKRMKSEKQ